MTISRISANLQEKHVGTLLMVSKANMHRCFNRAGLFVGVSVKEENDQWAFLPVGNEIWHDDETDTFVTRLPKPESIKCVS